MTSIVNRYAGGILSDPADQFPHWFGQVVFFRQFPYALTSIVAGMFSVGAAIGTIMFIKEVCSLRQAGS